MTDESYRQWIESVLVRWHVCDDPYLPRVVESFMGCIVDYRKLERHRQAAPSLGAYRSQMKKIRASALRLARDLAPASWKNHETAAAAIASQAEHNLEALRDAKTSEWMDHADCHSDLVLGIESVLAPLGIPISKGGVFVELCDIAWDACGLSGSSADGIDRARKRIKRMESQAKN